MLDPLPTRLTPRLFDQEELKQGANRSMEESVIAASLRGVRRFQSEISTLFRAMALIPEDVRAPLELLAMMYEAEVCCDGSEPAGRPTLLNIRRWLKVLLNRSLVLGTVDRASLHDIPRDYVVGQHSKEELRRAHHRLVQIIRQERPSSGRGWELGAQAQHAVSVYVCTNIAEHVRGAWDIDRFAEDEEAVKWLDDFPTQQDAVPMAAAHVLGVDRTTTLAEQAEAKGKWWPAALRWTAAGNEARSMGDGNWDGERYLRCLKSAVRALQRIEVDKPHQGGACSQLDKDRLELPVTIDILQFWDPKDQEQYGPRLEALLDGSKAAAEYPDLVFHATLSLKLYPCILGGDWPGVGKWYWRMAQPWVELALKTDDEAERSRAMCT